MSWWGSHKVKYFFVCQCRDCLCFFLFLSIFLFLSAQQLTVQQHLTQPRHKSSNKKLNCNKATTDCHSHSTSWQVTRNCSAPVHHKKTPDRAADRHKWHDPFCFTPGHSLHLWIYCQFSTAIWSYCYFDFNYVKSRLKTNILWCVSRWILHQVP